MEEAVYSDCHTLIKNFVEKGRPSFKSFCTVWKKLRFQHIFTNQSTYIQIQQTTACAFHFGKSIMGNRNVTRDNSFNFADSANEQTKLLQRIAGLYLLYAIYFKQPLNQYTKIEVSLDLWREMKYFMKNVLPAVKPEYDEARYVFWKLFQSQAFRFTALDYCVGLEGLVDYYELNNTRSNSLSQDTTESEGIEKHVKFNKLKQTVPALVTLEKGYNEMKSELTKLHQLDGKLLPPTNIFHNLRESFEKIGMIIDEADDDENDESVIPSSSKRRKLKDKAYGIVNDEKKIEEKADQKPGKYTKTCRMSVRTIFKEKLPDEIDDTSSYEDDAESDVSTQSSQQEIVSNTKQKSNKKSKKVVDPEENTTTTTSESE